VNYPSLLLFGCFWSVQMASEKIGKTLKITSATFIANCFFLLLFGLFPARKFLPEKLVLILISITIVLILWALLKIFYNIKNQLVQVRNNLTELKEEKQKLNGDINKAIFEMMALYEFTNILGTNTEYHNMLELIIDSIKRIIDYDRCCLFIYDETANELFSAVNRGFSSKINAVKIPLEQFWYGKSLLSGQAVLVENLSKEVFEGKFDTFRNLELLGDTKSFVGVPLAVQNKMIGVFLIAKDSIAGFSYENLRLLFIIASEAALTIQNTRLYEQVYTSSITDGLTGVYNHKYFREQIELQVQKAQANKLSLSLALIDIDFFKSFNDTYGHQVGDIVLKEVAQLIRVSVPVDHLVARYGGEEFAVIMPDTSIADAVIFCEKIRARIAEYSFRADSTTVLKVTVSLGVACFPEHIQNFQRMVEELIDLADEYLYYSKDKGRNRVSHPVWKFT
jgi:diguanylate cyclase (GGDEF)-like protein